MREVRSLYLISSPLRQRTRSGGIFFIELRLRNRQRQHTGRARTTLEVLKLFLKELIFLFEFFQESVLFIVFCIIFNLLEWHFQQFTLIHRLIVNLLHPKYVLIHSRISRCDSTTLGRSLSLVMQYVTS